MQPVQYTSSQTNLIDLGTKQIHKYPTPTKAFDIAHMVVNGRHPEKTNTFIIEHKCSFVMYILRGTGKVYAGDKVFEVKPEDVVFVPTDNKFAVEGEGLEYITFDAPAFFPEQSESIEI
jgi:mannose-6-phosphate isomerase-like protein (cupin superfamily)